MNNNFSPSSKSQCSRLLAYLLTHYSITTFQARSELDIMNVSQRIRELKDRGYNIVMHWTVGDSGKAKHRIASYVLLSGEGA